MYEWYRNSKECYAYLYDVRPYVPTRDTDRTWIEEYPSAPEIFKKSQWFTRGWTLQELIAPRRVKFFGSNIEDSSWVELGEKHHLLELLSSRTGIDRTTLLEGELHRCSVATRMSWASDRETTRKEDIAYCLLGIFDVNMPLLYGEGERAFLRLQEEILRRTEDHSLFAWPLTSSTSSLLCGALATSPSQFSRTQTLFRVPDLGSHATVSMTSKGLMIQLPILAGGGQKAVAILSCSSSGLAHDQVGLPLRRITTQPSAYYARDGSRTGLLQPIPAKVAAKATAQIIYLKQEPEKEIELRTNLLVNFHEDIPRHYAPVYFEPVPIAQRVDTRGRKTYSVPDLNGRCTVILERNDGSILVVLADISQQNQGMYACKVFQSVSQPEEAGHDNSFLDQQLTLQTVGTRLKGFKKEGKDIKDVDWYIEDRTTSLRTRLWDSNCRCSFDYLLGDKAIFAEIKRRVIPGGHIFLLNIEIFRVTSLSRGPYELPVSEKILKSVDVEEEETTSKQPDRSLKLMKGLRKRILGSIVEARDRD